MGRGRRILEEMGVGRTTLFVVITDLAGCDVFLLWLVGLVIRLKGLDEMIMLGRFAGAMNSLGYACGGTNGNSWGNSNSTKLVVL